MKNSLFLLIASLFFTTSLANAQSSESRIHLGKMQAGDSNNPQGLWPFLGVGAGFMGGTDTLRSGGLPMNVRVMGSYYFPEAPWVGEAGLGLFNQIFTQNGGGSDMHQAFYMEAAGRYKLEDKWQVGPSMFTLIDTSNRFNSGNHDLTTFIGAQALKEFHYNDYLMRAGGRLMVDMGISGETVPVMMFDLHMTWGDDNYSSSVVESSPAPIEEEPVVVREEPARPVNYSYARIVPTSDSQNFIVSKDPRYMKRLARTLANNKSLYERVEVVETSDSRMKSGLNVASELRKAGVGQTEVTDQGSIYNKKMISSDDYDGLTHNTRVELKFIGVRNEKALSNLIQSVEFR